ncbi:MAG: alanine racemase [Pseudomonadota bacterium]
MPPAALRLDIDLEALAANWRWFRDRSGAAATGAAVKADGYGLGADRVIAALYGAGCRDVFVTTFAEAATLARPARDMTIRALHGLRPADEIVPDVVPVLNSPEQIARWRDSSGGAPCDVMIDTGMNRLGIDWRGFAVDMLAGLNVDIVHSHLACADDPESPMNDEQLQRFESALAAVRAARPDVRGSLCGSGAVCLGPEYHFDLTRPGLGIYGGVPSPAAAGTLARVVRPHAEVLTVRIVPAGDSVGYGATWRAPTETRVATINLGYADGYLRGFSNAGSVVLAGRTRPVLGRVSMDLVTVDVGDLDVTEGDWVEIDYDLSSAAAASGLSQYELLTGLGHRYQRHYR